MGDEEIFRISIDKDRAKDLSVMAKERLEMIKLLPKDKTYKIIEEYYETSEFHHSVNCGQGGILSVIKNH